MEEQDQWEELPEVSVEKSAVGVESSAPELLQGIPTIPASSAVIDVDTGLQNISYDFDSWRLLEKTVNDDQESLQSCDPRGVLFPCEKSDAGDGELATLEPFGYQGDEAPSSSGVRLLAETLTVDAPKHFWEQDPFLRAVFGQERMTDVLLGKPSFKRPIGGAVAVETIDEEPAIVREFKRRVHKPIPLHAKVLKHFHVADSSSKRSSLVSDWASLVAVDVNSFAMGAMLEEEGFSRAGLLSSVAACMATKATATIHRRFCALNRFAKWTGQSGRELFPIKERVVFDYLTMLQDNPVSAPSSGQSLLQAINFASGVLGLKTNFDVIGQQRVKGVAEAMARNGPPVMQATPLTVEQVKRLETLACVVDSAPDRATLGGLLILMYSCSRHSDSLRIESIILDMDETASYDQDAAEPFGYIELLVLNHKAARSVKMKRTYLPMVCPMFSLSGEPWFTSWMEARTTLGMKCAGPVEYPLLCRFDEDGKPVKEEITATEVGALLREALDIRSESPHSVRSHSLKCTVLSWASKGGLSLATRRILGHHLDPGARSAEIYGRDTIAPSIRKLCSLLHAIKVGRFRPDCARSGRFIKKSGGQEAEDEGVESSDESIGDNSDASTDVADATDSEDEAVYGKRKYLAHLACPNLRANTVPIPQNFRTWRHKSSVVQHLQDAGGQVFLCGRKVSDRYVEIDEGPLAELQVCQGCMKSKTAAAAEGEEARESQEKFHFFL